MSAEWGGASSNDVQRRSDKPDHGSMCLSSSLRRHSRSVIMAIAKELEMMFAVPARETLPSRCTRDVYVRRTPEIAVSPRPRNARSDGASEWAVTGESYLAVRRSWKRKRTGRGRNPSTNTSCFAAQLQTYHTHLTRDQCQEEKSPQSSRQYLQTSSARRAAASAASGDYNTK